MDSDNKKISQLTQVTSLNDSDLFVVSIDVPSAPKTRAIKKSDITVSMVGCKAYNSTSQNTTSGASFYPSLDSEYWDDDTMHDLSTNNGRITFKTAGRYLVGATGVIAANANGIRDITIYVNGTSTKVIELQPPAPASNACIFSMSTIYEFAVNDYIVLEVYQNSGSTLALNPVTFWAQRVG